MYDELIAELRQHHCDAKEDDTQEVCEECCYDVIIVDKSAPSGFASVCACGLMNRAADAIEELSAIREEQKAQIIAMAAEDKPRWIPVTERLPELHDAEYLDEVTGEQVRYKESMPVLIWLAKGGFMDIGIYEKSDAVDDFCYQGIPHTVTYWMPLPDAPEEGETCILM